MARKWWTLTAVSVATFMLLLDITVVNVALPSIRNDLGGSFSDLQWVVDAYTLTLAALVLSAGSLADRVGRRRVFSFGLAIFSFASLLCALAPDPTFLNLSRALQGVGGAVMFAVSLALIAQEFPAGRERATAMGAYGATIGVAVAVGPLIGGALTDGLGWQSIFYLNVPIGLAAIAITHAKLRESRDPHATRIDWLGVATFTGALFMLVLALVRGNDEGWGSTMIVSLLAGSAALLAAFVGVESRVREPMLPLGLFRRASFTGVQLSAFALSASVFALFLYTSLYLQNYLGYSPFQAGLRYLPITVVTFLIAPVAGMLLSRVPARVLLSFGLATAGVGLLLMAGVHAGAEWTTLLAGFLVLGVGGGLLNPVIGDVALSVVPKERSGMAAGIMDTFRQVGVSVGVAVWGAVFVARGADKVSALAAGTPAAGGDHPRQLVEAASGGELGRAVAGVPPQAHDMVVNAAREGFLSGFNEVLVLGGIVCFVGAALALWLVREHEIEREPVDSVETQGQVALHHAEAAAG
ncbi:MAG TPA: MFS transporter [Solirubrobacterales bacterium]|jgi:EmrB/QacA subfamily drug resistance transporter|nr:MFS transporter [Solirubrobacterales bacterium]